MISMRYTQRYLRLNQAAYAIVALPIGTVLSIAPILLNDQKKVAVSTIGWMMAAGEALGIVAMKLIEKSERGFLFPRPHDLHFINFALALSLALIPVPPTGLWYLSGLAMIFVHVFNDASKPVVGESLHRLAVLMEVNTTTAFAQANMWRRIGNAVVGAITPLVYSQFPAASFYAIGLAIILFLAVLVDTWTKIMIKYQSFVNGTVESLGAQGAQGRRRTLRPCRSSIIKDAIKRNRNFIPDEGPAIDATARSDSPDLEASECSDGRDLLRIEQTESLIGTLRSFIRSESQRFSFVDVDDSAGAFGENGTLEEANFNRDTGPDLERRDGESFNAGNDDPEEDVRVGIRILREDASPEDASIKAEPSPNSEHCGGDSLNAKNDDPEKCVGFSISKLAQADYSGEADGLPNAPSEDSQKRISFGEDHLEEVDSPEEVHAYPKANPEKPRSEEAEEVYPNPKANLEEPSPEEVMINEETDPRSGHHGGGSLNAKKNDPVKRVSSSVGNLGQVNRTVEAIAKLDSNAQNDDPENSSEETKVNPPANPEKHVDFTAGNLGVVDSLDMLNVEAEADSEDRVSPEVGDLGETNISEEAIIKTEINPEKYVSFGIDGLGETESLKGANVRSNINPEKAFSLSHGNSEENESSEETKTKVGANPEMHIDYGAGNSVEANRREEESTVEVEINPEKCVSSSMDDSEEVKQSEEARAKNETSLAKGLSFGLGNMMEVCSLDRANTRENFNAGNHLSVGVGDLGGVNSSADANINTETNPERPFVFGIGDLGGVGRLEETNAKEETDPEDLTNSGIGNSNRANSSGEANFEAETNPETCVAGHLGKISSSGKPNATEESNLEKHISSGIDHVGNVSSSEEERFEMESNPRNKVSFSVHNLGEINSLKEVKTKPAIKPDLMHRHGESVQSNNDDPEAGWNFSFGNLREINGSEEANINVATSQEVPRLSYFLVVHAFPFFDAAISRLPFAFLAIAIAKQFNMSLASLVLFFYQLGRAFSQFIQAWWCTPTVGYILNCATLCTYMALVMYIEALPDGSRWYIPFAFAGLAETLPVQQSYLVRLYGSADGDDIRVRCAVKASHTATGIGSMAAFLIGSQTYSRFDVRGVGYLGLSIETLKVLTNIIIDLEH